MILPRDKKIGLNKIGELSSAKRPSSIIILSISLFKLSSSQALGGIDIWLKPSLVVLDVAK